MSEKRPASLSTELHSRVKGRRTQATIAGLALVLSGCSANTVATPTALQSPAETSSTSATPNSTSAPATTTTTPAAHLPWRDTGKFCTDSAADRNTPLKVGNGIQPNTFTIQGECAGDPNRKSSVYVPRSHPERVEGGQGQEATTLENGVEFAVGCLIRGDSLKSNAGVSSDLWARGIPPKMPAIGVVDVPVYLLGAPGKSFEDMIADGTVTLTIVDSPAPAHDCGPVMMPTYSVPTK